MKNKSIIKVREAWKTYKMGEVDVHALQGLDLDIKRGEYVAIMGASGSGKSTAVNMIGCLDIPTQGKVYLDGQDISKLTESQLAQVRGKKIGFIFQQFNLITTLTAMENVMLPMTFQGKSKAQRIARATKLLESVALGHRLHHRPVEMSGGEQQRIAIARALANDPELILADEPTGNLDSKTGKIIMHMLKELNQKDKKTIVVVTHDSYLARYADRLERLRDGKLISKR